MTAVTPTAVKVATSDSAVEKRKRPQKLVGMIGSPQRQTI